MGNQSVNSSLCQNSHTTKIIGKNHTNRTNKINQQKLHQKHKLIQIITYNKSHLHKLIQQIQNKINNPSLYLTKIISYQTEKEQLICSNFTHLNILIQKPQITLYKYIKILKRKKQLPKQNQILSLIYSIVSVIQQFIQKYTKLSSKFQILSFLSEKKQLLSLHSIFITQQGLIKIQDPQLTQENGFWKSQQQFQSTQQYYQHLKNKLLSQNQANKFLLRQILAIPLSLIYKRELDVQDINQVEITNISFIENNMKKLQYSQDLVSLFIDIFKTQNIKRQIFDNIKIRIQDLVYNQSENESQFSLSQEKQQQKQFQVSSQQLSSSLTSQNKFQDNIIKKLRKNKKKIKITMNNMKFCSSKNQTQSFQYTESQFQPHINYNNKRNQLKDISLSLNQGSIQEKNNPNLKNSLMQIDLDQHGIFTFKINKKHQYYNQSTKQNNIMSQQIFSHKFFKEKDSCSNKKSQYLSSPLKNKIQQNYQCTNLMLSEKIQRIISKKNGLNSQHLTRQTSNSDHFYFANNFTSFNTNNNTAKRSEINGSIAKSYDQNNQKSQQIEIKQFGKQSSIIFQLIKQDSKQI